MSMIYFIRQASDATIERLLSNPTLIRSFLGGGHPTMPKPRGCLLWFMAPPPAPPPTETVEFESGVEDCDLDKAWHGIHFLLTGSDWEGNLPEAFLVNGGDLVGDIDVGYGPARAYTASQTAEIDKCLSSLSSETLRRRFDPKRMMELDIYPTIWDSDPTEDDTLGYLIEFYELLKAFVARTAARGYGMVAYLS